MKIVYVLENSIYLNITNRCTNRCTFCIRSTSGVGGYDLWLEREPTKAEILDHICTYNLDDFKEIVFCGYGEPLIRLDIVLEIAQEIKSRCNIPIRINTNGQANLFHGYDVTPELKGLIDVISISQNAKNSIDYDRLCLSDFGEQGYYGMLDFAEKCKEYVPKVILTVVDVLSKDDIDKCREIAQSIGVDFKIRKFCG